LLLVSCANNQLQFYQNFDQAALAGMLYDAGNQPVSNMLLNFGHTQVLTDVNGRFSLLLKRGTHLFTAS
jgi:hypothetical protein